MVDYFILSHYFHHIPDSENIIIELHVIMEVLLSDI